MQIYPDWKKFWFLKNLECLSVIWANSTERDSNEQEDWEKKEWPYYYRELELHSMCIEKSREGLVRKIPQILERSDWQLYG